MRPDDLDKQMRFLEYFHSLRFLPGAWVILRLDGRGFSRFTESRFEKPFDVRFHESMVQTAQAVLEEFQGLYAYTESDEISVLLPRDWALFDRELEKTVSLSAGMASATFSLACGNKVLFDSRVWLGATDGQVVDYFRWRQADATRCALNGWCYWTLRKDGQSAAQATAALEGQGVSFKNFNPKLQQRVMATRRQVKVDRDLPMGEDYESMIRRVMALSMGTADTDKNRSRG